MKMKKKKYRNFYNLKNKRAMKRKEKDFILKLSLMKIYPKRISSSNKNRLSKV
jgi:hypothetical protein